MTTNLRDPRVLRAVSPMALSAYARSAGWSKTEEYGANSDVYAGSQLPEIIIPRIRQLGDYPQVVSRLIAIFAQAAEVNEVELYNDLVVADRDVFRVRASNGESDGSIDLGHGIALVNGARDIVLAAACSLQDPRPVYRAGANKDANDFIRRARLGQTENGSFVVTILSPVVSPRVQLTFEGMEPDVEPIERQISSRLTQALSAARSATSRIMGGENGVFFDAVSEGTSANLCEALAEVIEPFSLVDVSTTWARTLPAHSVRHSVQFSSPDASILREAARAYRSREPRMDEKLFGSVRMLRRDYSETDGTVTLQAKIDGKIQSVTVVLSESDYNRAGQANVDQVPISIEGDLERQGQRWRLLNPRNVDVIIARQEENESADILD